MFYTIVVFLYLAFENMHYGERLNERGKIALHRQANKHMLTVRVPCESEAEAEMFMAQAGCGQLVRNEWRGKVTWWVKWTSQQAARLLHALDKNGMLEGQVQSRARIGMAYTVLVYKQRKGHHVGQKVTEEQWAERMALVDKMAQEV